MIVILLSMFEDILRYKASQQQGGERERESVSEREGEKEREYAQISEREKL